MIERYEEIDIIIEYIHKHIEHPLTLSGLAKYVAYSPYHFTRIFKERTGLPPLYYISSLRLQKAKELLLRTNLNIRDIGLEIGQQSLGTFTTRFTEKVGVTPADFRNSMPKAESQLQSLRKLNDWYELQPGSNPYTRVEGTIQTAVPFEGVILIGLFTKPIPEGLPLYGTLVSSNKKYFCFSNVKPGIYYLDGYFSFLGDACDGFSACTNNVTDPVKGACYCRSRFHNSVSTGCALSSQAGRSSNPDFPASVNEKFPQSGYAK